jgi:glycopeptide antibiotics resistance protein
MTTAQLTAILFGLTGFVLVWPVVALLLLVLRRRQHALKGALVTLYATLTLAVVFLPLPGPDTNRLRQTIQLMPMRWVLDFGGGDVRALDQVVLNTLLFVPLGVLVWRRTVRQAALLGFGVSLLIEITQLTGNFGTAPFVYRIFDVDDLMTNTAGAALGWILATAITRVRVAQRMSHTSLNPMSSDGPAHRKPTISTSPHATTISARG